MMEPGHPVLGASLAARVLEMVPQLLKGFHPEQPQHVSVQSRLAGEQDFFDGRGRRAMSILGRLF